MKIESINPKDILPSPWRATYILKPDLSLLAKSIERYGWTSPILVSSRTMQVIDGHERRNLAIAHKLLTQEGGTVPVIMYDVSETDAMMMHVVANRARGAIMNARLSQIVRTVSMSGTHNENEIMEAMGIGAMEFRILIDGSLVKFRKVADHVYSKAWVPVEAKSDEKPSMERPPNRDR
jgi:hypothetical protein